jgi:hypothetical protein
VIIVTPAIPRLARVFLTPWVLGVAGMQPLMAQTTPEPMTTTRKEPCEIGRFREFDFWVGHWTVRRLDGELAGENTVTSEENGCVLVEHWTSASGATGQSLNFFDPAADRWRQIWVGLGLVLIMEGGLTNGAMVLQGPLQYLGTSRVTRLRGVWTPLPDGRVRQEFHESEDGGRNWNPWFDGYYSRSEAPHQRTHGQDFGGFPEHGG